jgi:hypothetical protein
MRSRRQKGNDSRREIKAEVIKGEKGKGER